jgi:uncharacterized membrane protein YccC
MLRSRIRKVFTALGSLMLGVLGWILFWWTPATWHGFLLYVVLFTALAAVAFILFGRNHEGYWPKPPQD